MSHRTPLETACKQYEEDLVLHYYGENSEDERRRVEEHLTKCLACRRFLEDLRGLLPRMADAEEMPQSFWDRYYREIVAKLDEQDERKNARGWRAFLQPVHTWMVPAFGTAAVAVLVIGLVVGNGNLRLFSEPRSEAIPQEILADQNQLQFFQSMDMLEALGGLEGQDDQSTDLNRREPRQAAVSGGVA